MSKKMLKRLGFAYILLMALEGAANGFFFAHYTPFLQAHGLSYLKMNLVNCSYYLVIVLFDPFTGNLADKYGRRLFYVCGTVFWAVSLYAYYRATTFYGFFFAEAIGAFAFCLRSAALDSWLTNIVGKDHTAWLMSKGMILAKVCALFSAIPVSMLFSTVETGSFWLMASSVEVIVASLALGFLFRFPGSRHRGQSLSTGNQQVMPWPQVLRTMLKHSRLRFVLLFLALCNFGFMSFNMFWPQVSEACGLHAQYRGFMQLAYVIPVALGMYLAGEKRVFLPDPRGFIALALCAGSPLLFISQVQGMWFFVGAFALHELGRGTERIVSFTYANQVVPQHIRSTANSIIGATRTFGGFLGLITLGVVADAFSPVVAWGVSGVVIMLGALFAIRMYYWGREDTSMLV